MKELIQKLNAQADILQEADEGTRLVNTTAKLKEEVNNTISLIREVATAFKSS